MTTGGRQAILVALFWLALVFASVMALLPQPPALPGNLGDKAQHVLAFASLTALAALAYRQASNLFLFGSLSLFGAGIELAQAIPALRRDADVRDWLADSAAILTVLCLCQALRHCSRLRVERAGG